VREPTRADQNENLGTKERVTNVKNILMQTQVESSMSNHMHASFATLTSGSSNLFAAIAAANWDSNFAGAAYVAAPIGNGRIEGLSHAWDTNGAPFQAPKSLTCTKSVMSAEKSATKTVKTYLRPPSWSGPPNE
jgi:hypothetical protein